ncbi:MAG: pyridoxal phosphate-dependent aminotransferase [Breznakia sp.]
MDINKVLSTRIKSVKPSGIRKFFDLASQMEGVISLGVGEPDFDTPWNIRESALYAIESSKTTYTENVGLLALRKAICTYQKKHYNLHYDPHKEILITVGGSEAIDIIFRSILNEGDEVIIPTPAYVAYEPLVNLAGGKVVHLPLFEKQEFKITPKALQACISDKTKAIVVNYPSNPTGGNMCKEDYEKIVPLLKKHNIVVLSDEIYADLIYEGSHYSLANFAQIKNQVLVISGCSKAFAMTGWRIGYVLGDALFMEAIVKLHQFSIMCAPTISQYAALEAFCNSDSQVEDMRKAYAARRNFIVKEFNRLGLSTPMPKGAFYIFSNISSTGLTSEVFCEALLQEQKVACVPGTAFGAAGEGYIRVSYAYSIDEIKVAIARIEMFLSCLSVSLSKKG